MCQHSHDHPRNPELLCSQHSRLFVIDVQDKLLPLIPVADRIVERCRRLIQAARILDVPLHVSEQYPTGLGTTDSRLAELLPPATSKIKFSCSSMFDLGTGGQPADGRYQIVLAGLESHVCIQQSALDLIAQGFRIYIAADAVASRHKFDWEIALQRMSLSGAVITTSESILFEWCEQAGTPQFRQIQQLIKDR